MLSDDLRKPNLKINPDTQFQSPGGSCSKGGPRVMTTLQNGDNDNARKTNKPTLTSTLRSDTIIKNHERARGHTARVP